MITIKTVSGHFNTIATSRSLTYVGSLRENYTAVGKSGVERQSTSKGTISIEFENNKSDIKSIEKETEGLVKTKDFEDYKNQTGLDLNDRVKQEELTLYQQSVDYELDRKVNRGTDLENEVVQNAETWSLSVNGKLSGQNYLFDGTNFSLGGNTNTAHHTKNQSIWSHIDGSHTKASDVGLERIINSIPHKYHDLMSIGEITTSSAAITVFLGDNFKGKDFVFIPFVNEVVGTSEDTFINNVELNIISKNIADATVTVEGWASVKLTEIDEDGFIKNLGTDTLDLDITYVAIA